MKRPTEENFRFDENLLPMSMYNSIEYWLPKATLPKDQMSGRFTTYLLKFRSEFIHYIERSREDQIPLQIKACKERCSLLCDFLQSVISLILDQYYFVLTTKNFEELTSDYKVRFCRHIVAYHNEDDYVDLEVNITNNPRMYKYLYYAAEVVLRSDWDPAYKMNTMIILQSMAYIYEAVKMTADESYAAQQEFLDAANSNDCWDDSSELSTIMSEVERDMKTRNPPLYIADFKQARRSHDGYLHNHPWTIEDAWISVNSSGSTLFIDGQKQPNVAVLMSAFEQDPGDPVDDIIGYKNFYGSKPFDGFTQYRSTTLLVPKTTSRGKRAVHTNSNPYQDKGSYIENMDKHILKNGIILCDTTYDDQEGLRFIREAELLNQSVLICTDMKGSTDAISHTFLKRFWDIMYVPGISDFLLRLHSGPGLFIGLEKTPSGYKSTRFEYNQISGIKCGAKSNFAVGLTEPHNFIVRCVMKSLGLEDISPLTLFRVHGDDIVFALPPEIADIFLNKYIKLCKEAGFRVHSIKEKGTYARPSDILYRAEFNKQTLLKGRMVSRIPHRLFFKANTPESQIAVLLWLSQYTYLKSPSFFIDEIFREDPIRYDRLCSIWNFLIDKKSFGIPENMRISHAYGLDLSAQFCIALHLFESCITHGVHQFIFNHRQRLNNDQVKRRIQEFTRLYDSDLIEIALEHLESQGIYNDKLHYIVDKNRRLADELYQVFKDSVLYTATLLDFFTEEEKEKIRKCLPYVRLSGLDYDEQVIDDLLSATKILRRIQPHSTSKQDGTKSPVLVDCLRKLSSQLSVDFWSSEPEFSGSSS